MPAAPSPTSPPARLLACALAAAAVVLGACGSSHPTGTSADPASAVPASALVYVGADVRPAGQEQTNAVAAGRSLTHRSPPFLRVAQILRTPGAPSVRYAHDVAPWLGPHAGLFATSAKETAALSTLLSQLLLGGSGPVTFPFTAGGGGAIVLDTSDPARARSFLHGEASDAGAHAASYRGVSYEVSSSGVAFVVVDRFAVLGGEAGLHGVIDTLQGGPALLHASGYAGLQAAAPAGAVAHVYVNPAAQGSAGGGIVQLLAGTREANISVVPAAGSLAIYVDASTTAASAGAGGLLAAGTEGAQALARLPGDSWLGVGLAHLGSTFARDVGGLGELGSAVGAVAPAGVLAPASGTLSVGGLLEGLLAPLQALAKGAKAEHDLVSWMGSGGVFASGSGLLELKAAVVIESHDPALSQAAVGKLAALLRRAGYATQHVSIPGTDAAVGVRVPGLPLILDIANGPNSAGGTSFVLGLGEASVTEALQPPSTLAGSQTLQAAARALGEGLQPSVVFQPPTLLGLLEGVGLTQDPTLARILPLLRGVSTVSAGGHVQPSGVERFKVVLGLVQSGS